MIHVTSVSLHGMSVAALVGFRYKAKDHQTVQNIVRAAMPSMQNSIDDLQKILDRFVDLGKTAPPSCVAVDSKKVVGDVVDQLRHIESNRNLTIECTVQVEKAVFADPDEFRNVTSILSITPLKPRPTATGFGFVQR